MRLGSFEGLSFHWCNRSNERARIGARSCCSWRRNILGRSFEVAPINVGGTILGTARFVQRGLIVPGCLGGDLHGLGLCRVALWRQFAECEASISKRNQNNDGSPSARPSALSQDRKPVVGSVSVLRACFGTGPTAVRLSIQ